MCLVTMLGHHRHTENGNLTMCQEVLPSAYVFHKFILFFQLLSSVIICDFEKYYSFESILKENILKENPFQQAERV